MPRRWYPDSDWFFGSEGTLHEDMIKGFVKSGRFFEDDPEVLAELAADDMRWVPPMLRRGSRAELLAHWYRVREVTDANASVEGVGETVFGLHLERARLELEYRMLSDHHALTPYYYGEGRRLPCSGRVSERRWMDKRSREIPQEVRRRLRRRRVFNRLFLGCSARSDAAGTSVNTGAFARRGSFRAVRATRRLRRRRTRARGWASALMIIGRLTGRTTRRVTNCRGSCATARCRLRTIATLTTRAGAFSLCPGTSVTSVAGTPRLAKTFMKKARARIFTKTAAASFTMRSMTKATMKTAMVNRMRTVTS